MAERPIYIPQPDGNLLVRKEMVEFKFHSGFAKVQKQKSIAELHQAARAKFNLNKILEVSSKSEEPLGEALSAFNLMINDEEAGKTYSVECAFQSSKVFKKGGPFVDLLDVSSREAKKDKRLKESGALVAFQFKNTQWPLEPKTVFYDWLYINALNKKEPFHKALLNYQAVTDIEFNPNKSINCNCQAYSVALFVALARRNLLDQIREPEKFLKIYSDFKTDDELF